MNNTLLVVMVLFYCGLFYFLGYIKHRSLVKEILWSSFTRDMKLYLLQDLVPPNNDSMYGGFGKTKNKEEI